MITDNAVEMVKHIISEHRKTVLNTELILVTQKSEAIEIQMFEPETEVIVFSVILDQDVPEIFHQVLEAVREFEKKVEEKYPHAR